MSKEKEKASKGQNVALEIHEIVGKEETKETKNVKSEEDTDNILIEKSDFCLRQSDYDRLEDGNMLNDVIINWYIKEVEIRHLNVRLKVFNTFFSSKIYSICSIEEDDKREQRYQQFLNWIDKNSFMMDYRFLLFPCILDSHWFLIIVCNKTEKDVLNWATLGETEDGAVDEHYYGKDTDTSSLTIKKRTVAEEFEQSEESLSQSLLETPFKRSNSKKSPIYPIYQGTSDDKKTEKQVEMRVDSSDGEELSYNDYTKSPCILIVDSLRSSKSSKKMVAKIKEFLRWEFKRNDKISEWENWEDDEKDIFIDVPQQKNGYDCGVYMLYFIKKFIIYTPDTNEKFQRLTKKVDPLKERKKIKEHLKKVIQKETGVVLLD
ncbi:hypothetical protein EIN_253620 [Entamoeba invadens IP1]|uniref:Ubiquitin-like protease family profile domain-containing protein n=1 Tax=Entamoeba invadens IP1 TaxID=370355 RepID=A0A0A1UF29_ENTIV|nr:hypothetical protein EIN_253620 [Entamoeba invadens IP1]ELP95088.1 hypothetical protein EIN_253620 [Entamoeba invadens IP1]|eukprot:XP_004261859.1 hypothetical protein EIN_253620 [Entamoeba invadens IP1]